MSGRIGIAVSGGPDSLALLLLADAACPGAVEAATVDHGLRPEAAGEAEMVARVCARLGVPHAILRGPWTEPASRGLQAAARAHRYRLLERWCGERGLRFLLTAHHADDQAETLLMRLSRGAGIGGLGGVRASRALRASYASAGPVDGDPDAGGALRLVRPLLRFTKAELSALVAAAGLVAVEDPSNDSDRFDRTRARRLLAATPWLSPRRLAASAGHLAEAESALRWSADQEYARRVERGGDAEKPAWMLDPAGLPDELLRRVIIRLWRMIEDQAAAGETAPDPPGPKLARLIDRLRAGETAMLGQVLARPGPFWRFVAAPPRRGPRKSGRDAAALDCH